MIIIQCVTVLLVWFSIVYQSEIVIKHAVREIQMFVWKFFSHTIIKKNQRLLLETALASFSRMSVKMDFCRNEISDSFLYVLYIF